MEQRVGRMRAARPDAFGDKLFDCRCDDLLILVADAAVFAGVRIEAADGDSRFRDAEAVRIIPGDDARGVHDQIAVEERRDPPKRHMDRERHDGEHVRPDQHHRERGRLAGLCGEMREIFGVAGKVEPRLVHH
jgi:hypothetical protein